MLDENGNRVRPTRHPVVGRGDDYLNNRTDLAAAFVRTVNGKLVVGGVRNTRTQREVFVDLGAQSPKVQVELRYAIADLLTVVLDEAQSRFKLGSRVATDPPIDPDVLLGGRLKCAVRGPAPSTVIKRKRAV